MYKCLNQIKSFFFIHRMFIYYGHKMRSPFIYKSSTVFHSAALFPLLNVVLCSTIFPSHQNNTDVRQRSNLRASDKYSFPGWNLPASNIPKTLFRLRCDSTAESGPRIGNALSAPGISSLSPHSRSADARVITLALSAFRAGYNCCVPRITYAVNVSPE